MADGEDRKDKAAEDESLPDFIDTEDESAEAGQAAEQGESESAASEESPEDEATVEAPTSAVKSGSEPHDTEDPTIHVKPHAEGLFETETIPESEIPPLEEIDPAYVPERRSKLAFGIIAGALLVLVAGGAWVALQEERRAEVREFLAGNIVDHKTAEVEKLRDKWRDEDERARNRYGDVTLTYFPPDAKVTVKQIKYHQDGESWRKQQANREKVGEEVLPNKTADLEEGQTVERLPLLNMPLFETDRGEDGHVSDVYTYEYELTFEREGYRPQTKKWSSDDWERVGPGNRIIDWQGLDLVPKPETLKKNFLEAMGEVYCLMKKKEIPTLQKAYDDENFETLLLRNGFKTKEDFADAYEVLTSGEHADWWKENQAEIQKASCDEGGDE
ncbi:MAG: hypothetical protein ACQEXJ_02605 [Myxococcota bacterium]